VTKKGETQSGKFHLSNLKREEISFSGFNNREYSGKKLNALEKETKTFYVRPQGCVFPMLVALHSDSEFRLHLPLFAKKKKTKKTPSF